jgi:hypothetical protein
MEQEIETPTRWKKATRIKGELLSQREAANLTVTDEISVAALGFVTLEIGKLTHLRLIREKNSFNPESAL